MKQLLKQAGYKDRQLDCLTRRLKSAGITEENLDMLPQLMTGKPCNADVFKLTADLKEALTKPVTPHTRQKKTKEENNDGNS